MWTPPWKTFGKASFVTVSSRLHFATLFRYFQCLYFVSISHLSFVRGSHYPCPLNSGGGKIQKVTSNKYSKWSAAVDHVWIRSPARNSGAGKWWISDKLMDFETAFWWGHTLIIKIRLMTHQWWFINNECQSFCSLEVFFILQTFFKLRLFT